MKNSTCDDDTWTTTTMMILSLLVQQSRTITAITTTPKFMRMISMMISIHCRYPHHHHRGLRRLLRSASSSTLVSSSYSTTPSSSTTDKVANTTRANQSTPTPTTSQPHFHYYYYRLLYFNTRGAAEPIRYFFALFGSSTNVNAGDNTASTTTVAIPAARAVIVPPYQDVRYPIQATSKGFGIGDPTYHRHQSQGYFKSNLNRLPVLQVVERRRRRRQSKKMGGRGGGGGGSGEQDAQTEDVIVAEIGQTYSILRYLSDRYLLGNSKNATDCGAALHRAYVDSFVEGIRDVKSAWFQAKKKKKQSQTRLKDHDGGGVRDPKNAKQYFLEHELPKWLDKLEASLPPTSAAITTTTTTTTTTTASSPWLFCTEQPTIADICLYSLLSTPTSVMTGTSQSFFDGADPWIVQKAFVTTPGGGGGDDDDIGCPRIQRSVDAMSKLPKIQQWEEQRPDTFN